MYAMVIGAVLALVGLLGFVGNPIVYETGAIFSVNMAQNVLHLVGGAVGIWLGMQGMGAAKNYNMVLGIIAAVLGVLWFIPGIGGGAGIFASTLNISQNISLLHVAIGAVSLGVAFGVKQ